MLIEGQGQAYKDDISLSFGDKNIKVGIGIYCSPHFYVSLRSYARPVSVNGENYNLVFQCRVNQKKTNICKGQ